MPQIKIKHIVSFTSEDKVYFNFYYNIYIYLYIYNSFKIKYE